MKIRQKILLGYAILSLLVVATGVVGYYASKRIGREFDDAVNRTLPVVQALEAIRFNAVLIDHRMRDAHDARTPGPAHAALQWAVMETQAAVARYRELVEQHFPHERPSAAKVARAFERLESAALHSGSPLALDGALEALLEATAAAMHAEAQELEEYQAGVEQALERSLAYIVLASVASFAGALLFGLLIARRISLPLLHLTATVSSYGRGALGARARTDSADEIGELGRTFNEMAQTLARTMVSRDYVETVLDSMSEAVIVLNADAQVERANGAARALLGAEALSGTNPRLACLMAAAAKVRGSARFIETAIDDALGNSIPIEVSSTVLSSGARPGGTVLVMRDIRERKNAEAQLHQMAHYDAVTGLPNRNLLVTMLRQALVRLPWHESHAAVLFADVDRFKFVNDSLGHQAGDELLRGIGERLRQIVRPGDLVARLGGDEFVILLNELAQPDDAARVAEKILRGVAEPMQIGGQTFDVTLSLGVCVAPADGAEPHELLRKADLAMYSAKREGKNRFCFYSAAMGERSAQHLALEADLRHALDAGEGLLVHYQPQESIGGTLTGVEALLRWEHPSLGTLSPARFLPIAEDADLMGRVDAWVLQAACAQLAAWRTAGLAVPRVSVNVSDQMFRRKDLVDLVRRTLDQTGLPAIALELELTEAIVMDDIEAALQTMTALRELGVDLSIDDFGTGYSSLAHLKRCPIQTLKIDRAFVGDLARDPGDAAIVQAIIAMARKLGISTLAEGVETPEQRRLLREFGIDLVQGYLISRPLPAPDVPAFLERHRAPAPRRHAHRPRAETPGLRHDRA